MYVYITTPSIILTACIDFIIPDEVQKTYPGGGGQSSEDVTTP